MEKDIRILEKWIEVDRKIRQNSTESDFDKFCEKKNIAIENLINRVKELEEENKMLNRRKIIGRIDEIKIEDLEDVLSPYYIPKSKIREIRDKAEVMDYYTLGEVIDDLNKLLGKDQ